MLLGLKLVRPQFLLRPRGHDLVLYFRKVGVKEPSHGLDSQLEWIDLKYSHA